mgnify:CR=1 FL=1
MVQEELNRYEEKRPHMISLAIVEDEEIYRSQLKEYIQRYARENGYDFQITVFRDGDEITENYQCKFEMILMDVKMEFMDGMTAAEKIRQQDEDVIIMFITNMKNYAIRGYEVDALDYILKPISYFAFEKSISRAIKRLGKREKKKTISIQLQSGGIQKLSLAEILYIESEAHILVFHTEKGNFRTYAKMKDMEEVLVTEGFFRCNKGYLVNLSYVDGVKDGCCWVNGEGLIISRAKRKEFMVALTNFIGEM